METRTAELMLTAGSRRKQLRMPARFVLAVAQSHQGIYETSQHLADLIGADPKDIIFTSGATESNNMALKGVARFHKEKRRHIITTQTVSRGNMLSPTNVSLNNAYIEIGAQMCSRLLQEASRRGL